MIKAEAVRSAIDYLAVHDEKIPPDVWKRAHDIRAFKADGDIGGINAEYRNEITASLTRFFEGKGPVTGPRGEFRRAMLTAFNRAFDLGWQDGGGEMPLEDDAIALLTARMDAESAHIDELFQQAKELRADPEADYFQWITARADGYLSSVMAVYNLAKMYAKKNQMLTWQYGETEHCATCLSLNGQAHRAKWYIARDYIPRKPGAAMDCGGYNCQCKLIDKSGNEFSL